MSDAATCPPVILLVYKRPDLTRAAVDSVRAARPDKVYVVADGPKNQEESVLTEETRRVIAEGIDWPCDIQWNAADENMGLANRVSSGITWAFESCEEAIVLEDDCVAHPDFFRFCAEMLDRYRDEEKVMCVTGDNFQGGKRRGRASYYFSMHTHCWGWATWKRAWERYDHSLACWPHALSYLESLDDPEQLIYWAARKEKTESGQVDSWAYRWTFSVWANEGLTVTPNVNLVENIGFGEGGTHCQDGDRKVPRAEGLAFPLKHPRKIARHRRADDYVSRAHFGIR